MLKYEDRFFAAQVLTDLIEGGESESAAKSLAQTRCGLSDEEVEYLWDEIQQRRDQSA